MVTEGDRIVYRYATGTVSAYPCTVVAVDEENSRVQVVDGGTMPWVGFERIVRIERKVA